MTDCVQQQIIQFNLIFKRYDDIYRRAARKFDIPELALWILYVLRENPECTQKDLVDILLQSKQSIHSALKSLIKDGYVELECSEKNNRSKQIHLTKTGIALAENTADKIVRAENIAFKSLSDSERNEILNLFERLTSALQKEMRHIQ